MPSWGRFQSQRQGPSLSGQSSRPPPPPPPPRLPSHERGRHGKRWGWASWCCSCRCHGRGAGGRPSTWWTMWRGGMPGPEADPWCSQKGERERDTREDGEKKQMSKVLRYSAAKVQRRCKRMGQKLTGLLAQDVRACMRVRRPSEPKKKRAVCYFLVPLTCSKSTRLR